MADLKGSVDYAAAEYLKISIVSHVTRRNDEGGAPTTLVVIKGHEIASIDTTVALVSAGFINALVIYNL